jgi:hypothetical protein
MYIGEFFLSMNDAVSVSMSGTWQASNTRVYRVH